MTFLEIIQSPLTNLPIEPDSTSFRSLIKGKFVSFLEVILSSSDLSEAINGTEFTEPIFKRRINALCSGILEAIDAYLEGNPSRAYSILSTCMKNSGIKGYLTKDLNLSPGTNLYRIRKLTGNFPLSKGELFHIPFQFRERVHTARFSISGLPSLYTSNAIFVAWEEMKRPSFNQIHAIRIYNTKSLTVLDITTDIFSRNADIISNTDHGWHLLYKVMVWPLLAACSVKVKYPDAPFKPEYIIPQLLMQWINKEEIDGIKYSSTNIDMNIWQHDGHFYNIAFPVKTSGLDEGYCPTLVNTFNTTSVVPMELRQFMSNSDRLPNQASINSDVNPNVQSIELIKGVIQPYSTTMFGILEHSLNSLETTRIN